jgi:hypothetical protein
MPTLSAITSTSGWFLAVRMGFLDLAYPDLVGLSTCPHCRPKIFTKLKQRLVPNLMFQYREPQASRHSQL